MPTFKPDKENAIIKKEEIKDIVLDNVSPRVITSEIVGGDVIKVLKTAVKSEPIKISIQSALHDMSRSVKNARLTKYKRIKKPVTDESDNYERDYNLDNF